MNTDDRELLELAAKAAGVNARRLPHAWPGRFDDEQWNPLADDGDALRLAVRLSLTFRSFEYKVSVIGNTQCDEYSGEDPQAATRRAIVRAAAEIGRSM